MESYEALVTAAQQGNTAVFGQLVAQFQDMAYFTAYRYLGERRSAQDAAQDAFFEAYRCLPKLREPKAFPVWLQRIVRKHCDRQTRGKRPLLVELSDAKPLSAATPSPDAMLEQLQQASSVRAAIAALPPLYREVTALYYLHGRSVAETAVQLDLNPSTVKKRLYDARQVLKEKLSPMATDTYRPSQDDTFAQRIRFFLALQQDDLLQIRQVVRNNPDLLTSHTEWGVASEGHYWPLGVTALHWAAGTGNRPLAALLLELGAEVNQPDHRGGTPLRQAAHMGQTDMVRWLLEQGADPNLAGASGQTALHAAVIRRRSEIVDLLLVAGADAAVPDSQQHTPRDWAIATGAAELIEQLGGEAAAGSPIRERQPPVDQCWETGIKIVDMVAPLRWGGRNGIFTPLSGIGIDVMAGELIRRMAAVGGRAVQLLVERGGFTATSRTWQWRNYGVESFVEVVSCREPDPAAAKRRAAETAVRRAEEIAGDQPVLLIIDTGILQAPDVTSLFAPAIENPAVTLLFDGIETIGAEPPELAALDAALTFDRGRARDGLWPAVDAARSYSRAYAGDGHTAVARRAVRLLRRYEELRPIYDKQGMAGFDLAYYGDAERQAITRGRRLHRFLSQPLFVAEPWSATPGTYVPLSETLQTTEAILNGDLDDVPEEELTMIGNWSPAWT